MTFEITFDHVMAFTKNISSPTAFEDHECHVYFDTLMSLEEGALIVEVGLEYGRSSSIALQVVKHHLLRYVGIDPFIGHDEIHDSWLSMASQIEMKPWRRKLTRKKADEVRLHEPINAILIDADHEYDAVLSDCEHFLPYVVPGGFAMFHDFGRNSLPGVYTGVTDYMEKRPRWAMKGIVGTLGIFKRK